MLMLILYEQTPCGWVQTNRGWVQTNRFFLLNPCLRACVRASRPSRYTANFFVNAARNSTHTFDYGELDQYIIWNYLPVFVEPNGSSFEQEYRFPPVAK
jgi:hypothetical protein